MNYRRLGGTGLKVSEVSLGAWTTFGQTVEEQRTITSIIEKAFELGINFFDNADVYHRGAGERTMGIALRDLGLQRHTYVLSSKVFHPMSESVLDRGLSRKHVLESIDMSLERLGVDHLDVYFAHRYDPVRARTRSKGTRCSRRSRRICPRSGCSRRTSRRARSLIRPCRCWR